MPALLQVPTPSQMRDAMLRVIRSGLIARGIPNPNVTSTSDYYVTAEAISQQLSVLFANQQIMADQTMPDTAEDDDLLRIAAIFNIFPREAQPSAGNIVLASSQSTFVPILQRLVDSRGQIFQVTTGGTYANGASIPIQGVTTGNSTNLPQGTALQWVGSPPAFASATASVGVGGLIGGTDIDNVETVRNRIYEYIRNPPQGGNAAQVALWSTQASASVQAGYVYPAINGPATLGLCVVGSLTWDVSNGWSRGVSDAVLGAVIAYVSSRLPEGVTPGFVCKTPKDTGLTTPDVDVDMSIGLSLPVSVTGGGAGGGWVDAVPWPDLIGSATRAYVSTVTDSTHITITSDDAANCPTSTNLVAGETEVCWFSSAAFAAGDDPVIVATVTAVSGSTGAIQITLSAPFAGIVAGDYVFPNSENVQTYARAFMAGMNSLGPGQWTSHPQVLVHGKRLPLTTASHPSDLTSNFLKVFTDAGEEVTDAAFLYRSASSPGVPSSTVTDSPFILVPRRLGLYNKII